MSQRVVILGSILTRTPRNVKTSDIIPTEILRFPHQHFINTFVPLDIYWKVYYNELN